MRLMKGAKKMLDIVEPVLESPILTKSPSSVHESHEEFYDAIMAEDEEEEEDEDDEEDEGEEHGLVSKCQVCVVSTSIGLVLK